MDVCIIGAGPVGLLQCLHLAKSHDQLNISIFERRSRQDLIKPSGEQRSINLALSWRGMRALEGVGLLQEVLMKAVPMSGRFIHPLNGNNNSYTQQPYSSHPEQVIYSIERLEIQNILLKAVSENCKKIKINFRQQLHRIEQSNSNDDCLILDFTTIKTVHADLVIGCDGTFSRVRSEMMKHFPGKVVQETFQHQYREFKIPAGSAFGPQQWLHIWPRKDLMLIALPNHDGSFTATLFCDFNKIDAEPVKFFQENFSDFLHTVGADRFIRDWNENPASKLITIQVDPIGIGRIVLLGDAAHSILPFYGQGMNAGFEDVQIFTEHLKKADICEAIKQYSAQRLSDARAIDLLARANYEEMRAQVLNPFFIYRSRALQFINKYFPTTIIPRYSMISFTSIPYSAIKRREICQDLIILVMLAGMVLFISYYNK